MKLSLVLLSIVFTVFMTVPPSALAVMDMEESSQQNISPLARAHAHNDYEHNRPLQDALGHGFTSVEADVWLVDGELLVAHDRIDVNPERTLQSLYLDPLLEKVEQNKGSVHKGYEHDFILWIDIKSDGEETYRAIHDQLVKYQKMLTKFTRNQVDPNAVTVYISGNRPRDLMEEQPVRYAAYDGRMGDLGSTTSQQFMPVISDNWFKHFTWVGIGPMPKEEKEKLRHIVSTAHANGQKVRFWATPDLPSKQRESIWLELLKADVDLINTDDLKGLQEFLMKNDPNRSEPTTTWNTRH